MTNFVVTNVDDSGDGSLRQAILDANSNEGADTISFEAESGVFADTTPDTITLTSGELFVTDEVIVQGTGSDKLTISGENVFRVFYTVAPLTIDGLTIANGNATYNNNDQYLGGGGILSDASLLTVSNSTISGNSAVLGGGILSYGGVNISNSTISGNTAQHGGGIYYNDGGVNISNSTISGNTAQYGGGGINSDGDGTVSNSTISGNTAQYGGGIYNYGVATVSNSTISGNTGQYGGGGIYNDGHATVSNSTISGNTTTTQYYGGGGIYNYGVATVSNSTISGNTGQYGGGIYNDGDATVSNSIIAGNQASDIYGGNINGDAYNLIGTANDIQSGTLGTGTDIVNSDPGLEPLAYNGGSTQTHALKSDSLAVNAGDPNYDNLTTDQRGTDFNRIQGSLTTDQRGTGFNRIQGSRLDIGAFESGFRTQPDPIQYAISSDVSSLDEGNSGSQPVTFTVTRSGGIDVASTVDYALSGTASLGSDYNIHGQTPSLFGTLNFAAGEETKTIRVDVLGDTIVEDDEDITITLSSSNPVPEQVLKSSILNSSSGSVASVNIINDDKDDVPTSVPTLINEILFDVTSTDTTKEYIELRGTPGATLAAGTYLVGIEGDSGSPNPGNIQNIFDLSGKQFGSNGLLVLLQKGSTYVANPGANVLTNAGTGAGWGNGTSSSIGHTGSTTDIESGSVSFLLIESATAPTLSNDIDSDNDGIADGVYSDWNVLDSVSVLDGGKTDSAYSSIVFKRGSTGGSVPANATVVNTSFVAGYVGRSGDTTGSTASDWVASSITGTAPNFRLGIATKTSPGNFAEQPLNHIGSSNFAPPSDVDYAISTSTPTVTEGNSGRQAVSFTVTRSGNTAVATTVNYVLDGTTTFAKDYNTVKVAGVAGKSSGTIKFAADETTKTISLNVASDKLPEVDETINLTLSSVNKTDPLASGTITIVDDDVPTISIADKTGKEDGGNFVFTVKLSTASAKTITVDYSTSNDTAQADADYTAVKGSLTFDPGVTTQTITVPILNDFVIESSERFFVDLANPTNATIADNKAIGTITDDDKAGFTISPANGLITNEAGGTADFNIQLTTQPTADVTLTLSSSKMSEGTVSVPTVTFTAANWNTPQTITVTGVDDGIGDDNIAYQIVTSKAVSTDIKYNNLNPADIDVINIKSGNEVSSIITGTALANTLLLQGTSLDHLIFGFAGNDVIVGGEGNDRIYGGLGADNLTGGAGNDIFVLAKGEGRDIIKDFKTGEDLIALSGGLIYSGLSFTQIGNDTLIKSSTESLALLTGIMASTLSANDFTTVGMVVF
ncbi:beta strand repeat-containing protein [Nostoc sp. UHCC 0252]|uniref:beta strand repeat-containing protein n=1 Tax=Nostoc sp. UHCC 0252 TaxID=3110241 RepID=UPI002B1F84EF|nr:Calx-beta domain-containing protein [Nostoc sp. UHCC 0252]MEA5604254.1 Calx-beta domain-containing protein [Nostoc sp. UHCC 0252]